VNGQRELTSGPVLRPLWAIAVVVFSVALTLGIYAHARAHRREEEGQPAALFTWLLVSAGAVLLSLLLLRRLGADLAGSLRFRILRPRVAFLVLFISAASLPLGMALRSLFDRWIHVPPEVQEAWWRFFRPESALGWVAAIGIVVLAGPVLEEVLFRGILQTSLETRFGAFYGVLATAALFGAAHGLWELDLFFDGLMMGALVSLTGSLLAGVIYHVVLNTCGLVVANLLSAEELKAGVPPPDGPVWGSLAAIALALAPTLLLFRLLRRETRRARAVPGNGPGESPP
jgi:membrane protease YdiL (CAAX protease family)